MTQGEAGDLNIVIVERKEPEPGQKRFQVQVVFIFPFHAGEQLLMDAEADTNELAEEAAMRAARMVENGTLLLADADGRPLVPEKILPS